jgi:hypothetical protein
VAVVELLLVAKKLVVVVVQAVSVGKKTLLVAQVLAVKALLVVLEIMVGQPIRAVVGVVQEVLEQMLLAQLLEMAVLLLLVQLLVLL